MTTATTAARRVDLPGCLSSTEEQVRERPGGPYRLVEVYRETPNDRTHPGVKVRYRVRRAGNLAESFATAETWNPHTLAWSPPVHSLEPGALAWMTDPQVPGDTRNVHLRDAGRVVDTLREWVRTVLLDLPAYGTWYALLTKAGAALEETALCAYCYPDQRLRTQTRRIAECAPGWDYRSHVNVTGNDTLTCHGCGRPSGSPRRPVPDTAAEDA